LLFAVNNSTPKVSHWAVSGWVQWWKCGVSTTGVAAIAFSLFARVHWLIGTVTCSIERALDVCHMISIRLSNLAHIKTIIYSDVDYSTLQSTRPKQSNLNA